MNAANAAAAEPERDLGPMLAALSARGAGRVRHGPWSLLRHLRATHDLLAHWGMTGDLRLAGLCHSIYGTDEFSRRTFAPDERDNVRRLIGERAERLAFLFSAVPRAQLGSLVRRAAANADTALTCAARGTGTDVVLSGAEAGALAILSVANEAEQCRSPHDGGPGVWLTAASRLVREARPLMSHVPPIFNACTATLGADDERLLLEVYRDGWRADRNATHGRELGRVAARLPWVAEPYLLLALKGVAGGRPAEAATLLATAAPLLDVWGTAWDKRLSHRQWRDIAAFVANALSGSRGDLAFIGRRIDEAAGGGITPQALYAYLRSLDVMGPTSSTAVRVDAAAEPVVAPSMRTVEPAPALAEAHSLLPRRFAEYAAGFGVNAERPLMGAYPGLAARAWHDPAAFPIARAFEASASAIGAEIAALDTSAFHPESEDIARDGRWDVLMLLERGRANGDILARCPVLAGVLQRYGAIEGLAGLAYVSRLAPGTDIAPHRGPTNMRLRCHLGIRVPDGCGLRVDGETRTWTTGQCLVFDDSFEHSAWNHGVADRLVLIADVWHPDLTIREIELLAGLHRYAHAHAENLADYWARNENARGG